MGTGVFAVLCPTVCVVFNLNYNHGVGDIPSGYVVLNPSIELGELANVQCLELCISKLIAGS